jgi:hypothetical protein
MRTTWSLGPFTKKEGCLSETACHASAGNASDDQRH